MRRRDADKLPAADSVNRNATAADLMRHACTKDHAPGLDPGPSAWHITKVTKHVARAKQQESAGQQSGEKRTVARLHSQRCTRCTAEVLTWLQTAPSRGEAVLDGMGLVPLVIKKINANSAAVEAAVLGEVDALK
ncbi:hypothetical protein ABBQ38_006816 [Trebouxia sp. C0009 RCD-2024]